MNQQEYTNYVNQLEKAYESEKTQREQLQVQMGKQTSSFSSEEALNLIHYQLELDNILERLGHILKGDQISFDLKGNVIWSAPEDKELRLFNEYGVQEILRIISLYINRNTILSYWEDIKEIDVRMLNFSYQLIDLVHNEYEKMGLDTLEKQKVIPMMLTAIIDAVESTFRRALYGRELNSLREARHVSQSYNPLQSTTPQFQTQGKNFSIFKPSTWGRNQ